MSLRWLLRATLLPYALLHVTACTQQAVPVEALSVQPARQCVPGGHGRLQATVRGALSADIDWTDAEMECDGGPRPDGKGLRVVMAGALQGAGTAPRQLRFIFGIDLQDSASGAAQVLATNLTVIVEGEGVMFSTRGADRCAVEDLVRLPLGDGAERVSGRGYCLGPASDLAGETRILVPTFTFSALVRGLEAAAPEESPPAAAVSPRPRLPGPLQPPVPACDAGCPS